MKPELLAKTMAEPQNMAEPLANQNSWWAPEMNDLAKQLTKGVLNEMKKKESLLPTSKNKSFNSTRTPNI